MGEDESRWYYVGDGQLRRKDSNGWTDEYQDIDEPKRAAQEAPAPSVEVLDEVPEPIAGTRERGWGARTFSSAARGLAAGVIFVLTSPRRLITRGHHGASESGPGRSGPGRHRSGAHRAPARQSSEADQPTEALSPTSST